MQGLWNLIGKMGTVAQSFPYEVGEKLDSSESKTPWSLHRGKKKVKFRFFFYESLFYFIFR